MGKVIKSAVTAMSLGTIDLVGDPKKASGAQAAALEEEKKVDMRKRKALYNTQGGVLGQEVNQVGLNNRGNIFGN